MASIEDLSPGDELVNEDLCGIFKCGPQGGMRRSLVTNSLVLVCNHVSSIYDDRWIGNVLHYTGMGQTGDQSLSFMQNRTLAESPTNGVGVHLFEVHRPKVYTYVGEMELVDSPYAEQQLDEQGHERQVWIFPIRPKSGELPAIPVAAIQQAEERTLRQARRLSDDELALRAQESGRAKVGARAASVRQFQRSVWVAEHARRRAKGRCDLCNVEAPFNDKGGKPYLETHHIVWLARGGADTIENTAALCPNCHRRMHILDNPADMAALEAAIAQKAKVTLVSEGSATSAGAGSI